MDEESRWKDDIPAQPLDIKKPDTSGMTPDELKAIGYLIAFSMKLNNPHTCDDAIGLLDTLTEVLAYEPAVLKSLPDAPKPFDIYVGGDYWGLIEEVIDNALGATDD